MKEDVEHAVLLFRKRLLAWYSEHGRHFPWRDTRDPYHVLIAERMLHRTRADQVLPVYERFLTRYPTVDALAAADPAEVRVLLAPLGLVWRFDSFVPMARRIVGEHGSRVPETLDALLALPGVGRYTAEAVLCFAFNQAVAVVDTNTIRVAGRYLAGVPWVADARKRQHVRQAVDSLLDRDRPASANYAILDLAALICVARLPLCHTCPVATGCAYRRQKPSTNTQVEQGILRVSVQANQQEAQ